ncbi:vWA domain-containing protein [Corynebacterium hindlerae]|uniref:vWA domain-containing protein n=1 Tax=Corynebacterium hindlerae TaxID=699041 RepID=UPI0031B68E3B
MLRSFLLAVALMLLPLPIAQAQEATNSTMLIMDASGSMEAPDGSRTRMDSAKEAAHALVDSLPETANVGFMAYGAKESNAPENKEKGCQDIETLVPVGALDRKAFHSGIDGLKAKGYTPMANSLLKAAKELPATGERSIILVSDGIDSCAPPEVCTVAKDLAKQGVGLTIHTVGFQIDEAARAELQCIAQASGGQYREARDAAELTESLDFLAKRAAVTYQTAGTDFEFADTIDGAKWLGEGLYQTRVVPNAEKDGKLRYIRIAVPKGHDAYVSITGIPDRDKTGTSDTDGDLNYWLEDIGNTSNGKDCDGDKLFIDLGQTHSDAYSPPEPEAAVIRGEGATDCDMDQWYLGYDIHTTKPGGGEVSVEIQVSFEPIVPKDQAQKFPAGDTGAKPNPADLPFKDIQPITGGSGFNDATPVTSGAYSDSLVPGEYKFYRISVNWGQRPVVTLKPSESKRNETEHYGATIYSPIRADIESFDASAWKKEDVKPSTATLDRAIQYHNRTANAGGEKQAMAGDYFIGISMYNSSSDKDKGVDQPFEIAFDVVGKSADGPEWRPKLVPGPKPLDKPASDTTSSAAAPSSASDEPAVSAEPVEKTGMSLGQLAIGGGAVAGVIVLVAVALLVMRRK